MSHLFGWAPIVAGLSSGLLIGLPTGALVGFAYGMREGLAGRVAGETVRLERQHCGDGEVMG